MHNTCSYMEHVPDTLWAMVFVELLYSSMQMVCKGVELRWRIKQSGLGSGTELNELKGAVLLLVLSWMGWKELRPEVFFGQHFVPEKELMVVTRGVARHHLTWTSVTKLNNFRLDKDFWLDLDFTRHTWKHLMSSGFYSETGMNSFNILR